LKKAPFLSCGHLSPSGGKKKNFHSLTGGCVAQLSLRRRETQGFFLQEYIQYIHYNIPCLANWITGYIYLSGNTKHE